MGEGKKKTKEDKRLRRGEMRGQQRSGPSGMLQPGDTAGTAPRVPRCHPAPRPAAAGSIARRHKLQRNVSYTCFIYSMECMYVLHYCRVPSPGVSIVSLSRVWWGRRIPAQVAGTPDPLPNTEP